MKKLYTTADRILLYLLKSRLEEKGIQCLIKNEDYVGPAAGEVPPVVARPELWVMVDATYAEGKALVQEELLHRSQPKKSWHCTHCNEVMEGQFEVCWKCGRRDE